MTTRLQLGVSLLALSQAVVGPGCDVPVQTFDATSDTVDRDTTSDTHDTARPPSGCNACAPSAACVLEQDGPRCECPPGNLGDGTVCEPPVAIEEFSIPVDSLPRGESAPITIRTSFAARCELQAIGISGTTTFGAQELNALNAGDTFALENTPDRYSEHRAATAQDDVIVQLVCHGAELEDNVAIRQLVTTFEPHADLGALSLTPNMTTPGTWDICWESEKDALCRVLMLGSTTPSDAGYGDKGCIEGVEFATNLNPEVTVACAYGTDDDRYLGTAAPPSGARANRFSIHPHRRVDAGPVEIQWDAPDAASCVLSANGEAIAEGTVGSFVHPTSETTNFVLDCQDSDGHPSFQTSKSVVLPEITSFELAPGALRETVQVNWKAPLMETCTLVLESASGAVTTRVGRPVESLDVPHPAPGQETAATLTCSGFNRRDVMERDASWSWPELREASAVPAIVPYGGGTTSVCWDARVADDCTVDGIAGLAVSGCQDVAVTFPRDIAVTCYNRRAGTSTDPAIIPVSVGARAYLFSAPPPLVAAGENVSVAWAVSGAVGTCLLESAEDAFSPMSVDAEGVFFLKAETDDLLALRCGEDAATLAVAGTLDLYVGPGARDAAVTHEDGGRLTLSWRTAPGESCTVGAKRSDTGTMVASFDDDRVAEGAVSMTWLWWSFTDITFAIACDGPLGPTTTTVTATAP